MQWKDHFRDLENMRDSTRTPQHSSHQRLANGGSLQHKLKELTELGRHGDTQLAEIGPRTARMLDKLIHGGHRQINPRSGLREYGKKDKARMVGPAAGAGGGAGYTGPPLPGFAPAHPGELSAAAAPAMAPPTAAMAAGAGGPGEGTAGGPPGAGRGRGVTVIYAGEDPIGVRIQRDMLSSRRTGPGAGPELDLSPAAAGAAWADALNSIGRDTLSSASASGPGGGPAAGPGAGRGALAMAPTAAAAAAGAGGPGSGPAARRRPGRTRRVPARFGEDAGGIPVARLTPGHYSTPSIAAGGPGADELIDQHDFELKHPGVQGPGSPTCGIRVARSIGDYYNRQGYSVGPEYDSGDDSDAYITKVKGKTSNTDYKNAIDNMLRLKGAGERPGFGIEKMSKMIGFRNTRRERENFKGPGGHFTADDIVDAMKDKGSYFPIALRTKRITHKGGETREEGRAPHSLLVNGYKKYKDGSLDLHIYHPHAVNEGGEWIPYVQGQPLRLRNGVYKKTGKPKFALRRIDDLQITRPPEGGGAAPAAGAGRGGGPGGT